ncbi:tumor necrosis factor receptor superfamily member 3 [Pelobates cultripes]|uniref:Tumor necrosis factor receptor superfamily member 3 n=1 Tax=Pelobates cultripes TaxID=61616 RepID=A0AAD1TBA4_PELCU|nr:tumor necrosis factor receptor superfamily member 3 [Pelobates cultripes]
MKLCTYGLVSSWSLCHLFFLFLLSDLGETNQANRNCNGDNQYYNPKAKKCCDRCAPGKYVKRECDSTTPTQCENCPSGSYTKKWNYVEKCSMCRPCGLDFIVKVNCSATQETVCECQEGFECHYRSKQGCMACLPSPISPLPLTEKTTGVHQIPGLPPDNSVYISGSFILIVTLILVVILGLMVFYMCKKCFLLKKIAKILIKKNGTGYQNEKGTNTVGGMGNGHNTNPFLQLTVNETADGKYMDVAQTVTIIAPERETGQCIDRIPETVSQEEELLNPLQCTGIRNNPDEHDIINIYSSPKAELVLPQVAKVCVRTPKQVADTHLSFPIQETQQPKGEEDLHMALEAPSHIYSPTPSDVHGYIDYTALAKTHNCTCPLAPVE